MRFIFIILFLCAALLLQSAILPYVELGKAKPNLFLIIVIFVCLTTSWQKSFAAALLAGVLLDIFSGWPFGIFSLSLLLISFVFNSAKTYLFGRFNFLVWASAIFAGTILCDIEVIFFMKIMHWLGLTFLLVSFKNLFFLIPREIVYNLIVVGFFYLLWKGLITISKNRPNFFWNQKKSFWMPKKIPAKR